MKVILFSLLVTFVQCAPLYMTHQVQEDYVPIVGYHELGDVTSSLIIKVSDYRDQVDYLTNTMGCNWITMRDLTTYVAAGEKLPTKTCIMNFDDGTADHYHKAYCSLNEHGVPATFYIATGDLDTTSNYMTTSEVADLADKGHDMAPHTVTHANLAQLSSAQQVSEIVVSKNVLNSMGYDVKTFAYPFGAYNGDTLNILRNDNDLILTRDTSQDTSWKDIRTPVVSFNADNDLHFFYIKPEGLSGSQLADKIKYIGWWQLEDNFKIISGTSSQIIVRSGSNFHPTDTSYAVLVVSGVGSEFSTQFITKYSGGFTLDILASGSGTFDVKVDGVTYTSTAFPTNDPGYLTFTSSGSNVYVNYYVNIPSLSPGTHTLNIVNTNGAQIIFDKFRLWSDTDQDFSDESAYNACDPSTDAYCDCDFQFPADPTCENGFIGGVLSDVCCKSTCLDANGNGQCGGSGCSSLSGGSSSCCSATILANGESCDLVDAPCVLTLETPPPTPSPQPDPTCSLGVIGSSAVGMNVCCDASCGVCGQTGCGSLFPGSAALCCGGSILNSGVSCDTTDSPCIISMDPTPSPVTPSPVTPSPTSSGSDPMCALGLIKQDVCCPTTCGTCGGVGCSLRPGGSACCGGPIRAAGLSCNDGLAPCVIGLP